MRKVIGTRRAWLPMAAAAAMLPVLAVHAPSAAQSVGATPAALPDAPGRASLLASCSGCHAASVVVGERHSADEWSAIIAVMIDRGAQVNEADNAAITAYLAKNFGKPDAAPAR